MAEAIDGAEGLEPDEYQWAVCVVCGGVFRKRWLPAEGCATIACDDCYKTINALADGVFNALPARCRN